MFYYAKIAGDFGKEKGLKKMAVEWYSSSQWRGLDGRTTVKRYRLRVSPTDPIDEQVVAAQAFHDAIVSALDDITEATMQDQGVARIVTQYQAGLGDLTENALVNVWAEDPQNAADVLSISQVYVPAPVVTIFMGTSGKPYNQVDPSDGLLQAFIDALSTGAYISDMEVIDTGTAVNGIEDGRRVTRKLPRGA